jgi:hypothetical protein
MVMNEFTYFGTDRASAASRLRLTSGFGGVPTLGTLFKRVMINVAWAFALIIVYGVVSGSLRIRGLRERMVARPAVQICSVNGNGWPSSSVAATLSY